MSFDLHHAHLFASDIDVTVAWWCQHLGGKILFDGALSGSRNVFLAVGSGRLHIYDQPPRGQGRNAIHHLGIKVAHLKEVWQHFAVCGPHLSERAERKRRLALRHDRCPGWGACRIVRVRRPGSTGESDWAAIGKSLDCFTRSRSVPCG